MGAPLGCRLATPKVRLAARVIRKANPRARVMPFRTDMENPAALEAVKGCDYIFLAADSHRARLLFNALVHQFLIPGAQLGSRIRSDAVTGAVEHVHTVTRWVLPDRGVWSATNRSTRPGCRKRVFPPPCASGRSTLTIPMS